MNRETCMDGSDVRPPIGGANLECLLKCRSNIFANIESVLGTLNSYGFNLKDDLPILVYRECPVEPDMILKLEQFKIFQKKALQSTDITKVIANFYGLIHDQHTSLSVVFNVPYNVVTVSMPEDVLWASEFNEVKPEFLRLKDFAKHCEKIASGLSAYLGFIGTEHLLAEEITIEDNNGVVNIEKSFFSEEELQELFLWYTDTYIKRWD